MVIRRTRSLSGSLVTFPFFCHLCSILHYHHFTIFFPLRGEKILYTVQLLKTLWEPLSPPRPRPPCKPSSCLAYFVLDPTLQGRGPVAMTTSSLPLLGQGVPAETGGTGPAGGPSSQRLETRSPSPSGTCQLCAQGSRQLLAGVKHMGG